MQSFLFKSEREKEKDTNTGLRYGRYNEYHYNGSLTISLTHSPCLPPLYHIFPSIYNIPFHEATSQLHCPSHHPTHHTCKKKVVIPSPVISLSATISLSGSDSLCRRIIMVANYKVRLLQAPSCISPIYHFHPSSSQCPFLIWARDLKKRLWNSCSDHFETQN